MPPKPIAAYSAANRVGSKPALRTACPPEDLEHFDCAWGYSVVEKRRPSEVLIVEDESLTRMNAAEALTQMGFRTREAGDAREALRVLEANPKIDLLFTDVDMPGAMDGLDLAEKVHRDWPDMELIVTSGARGVQDADLPDAGTFLPKPYFTDRLIQIVTKKLGSHTVS